MTNRRIKIGDVYHVRFNGEQSVQRGWRPGVVFQNNIGNDLSPNVIVLPLTTALKKRNQPTHVVLSARETGLKEDSMVLCENPTCISKNQLGDYITTLPSKDMKAIAVASLLATSAVAFLDLDTLRAIWRKASRLNGVHA